MCRDLQIQLKKSIAIFYRSDRALQGQLLKKYRNEEALLATQPDPEKYNREVIFMDKVRLNREYVENYRFSDDLKYIFQTIVGK
jgi:hypothetical protein